MKKSFSIFLALYFAAIIGLVQITTENKAFAASGKKLFKKNCQSCHGKKGKGANAPNIQDERFKEFKRTVKKGKGSMPSFSSLKKRSIKKIWKYVTR
ncbi:MAG: cytochrome c [Candidatus Schekmanbacteria bacterium]|nr:MAG: cytochrome c [Candidatus Schekmanbacteria bacterium]